MTSGKNKSRFWILDLGIRRLADCGSAMGRWSARRAKARKTAPEAAEFGSPNRRFQIYLIIIDNSMLVTPFKTFIIKANNLQFAL